MWSPFWVEPRVRREYLHSSILPSALDMHAFREPAVREMFCLGFIHLIAASLALTSDVELQLG